MKKFLLAICAVIGTAQAASASIVYEGTIVSREQCEDSGQGAFSTELGCKKIASPEDRRCAIAVTQGSNGFINSVQIEIPGLKSTGDTRKDTYSGSVEGPYAYTSAFNAYTVTLDRSETVAVEIKASAQNGRLMETNIYAGQVTEANGHRLYKLYSCKNLKRTR